VEHDEEFQKVLTYAAAQLAESQKPRHLKADLIARGAPPEVAEQALAIARERCIDDVVPFPGSRLWRVGVREAADGADRLRPAFE
jgi:hypothetical protein